MIHHDIGRAIHRAIYILADAIVLGIYGAMLKGSSLDGRPSRVLTGNVGSTLLHARGSITIGNVALGEVS